uniref:Uncharacterized protein n=1 Tax=Bicosoecida sp. CB-2014 TaxID=1486930 RepID=A0A7S1GCX4_9STRA|mmetsp:Transcript_4334/g.15955  ORF Transcript_4334/g.15955 Transcript_4334/m.15955 type:complete len:306 (+) Transcript_4334:73-990(+)
MQRVSQRGAGGGHAAPRGVGDDGGASEALPGRGTRSEHEATPEPVARPRRSGGSQLALLIPCLVICSAAVVVLALWGYQALLRVTTPTVTDRRRVPIWDFPDLPRLEAIKAARMRASSSVALDDEGRSVLHIGSVWHAKAHPHTRGSMPEALFGGVMYGITAWNALDKQESVKVNRAANVELRRALESMRPRPDAILPSVHADEEGGTFREEGFVLHFAHAGQDVERAVLVLARVFGQVCVYKWWPHVWGVDPAEHVTVMQSLVAVASAVRGVKADGMARIVEVERGHEEWLHDRRARHRDETEL